VISGAAQAIAASLRATAGKPCVYRRGAEASEIIAYPGLTSYEVTDSVELVEQYQSRDFLFLATDLVLGGVQTLPERGDQIEEDGSVFDVMAPQGAMPYRFCDIGRTLLRVHTKR